MGGSSPNSDLIVFGKLCDFVCFFVLFSCLQFFFIKKFDRGWVGGV